MTDSEDSSLLVVLLETHANLWGQLTSASDHQQLTPSAFMEQVLSYLNSFLLMSDGNRLAVFAIHIASSHMLYQSPSLQSPTARQRGGSQEPPSQAILQQLQHVLQDGQGQQQGGPMLAAALSRALCYLRQHAPTAAARAQGRAQPRLLCLAASSDTTLQYIPTMNAIFAAQKLGVVIDACMVGSRDSAFLQQAAHLTGGLYLRPPRPAALLQYLLTLFLADVSTRKLLQLPPEQGVNFSASCFCHKKSIDLGFVCSVCLSIFCQEVERCMTCGTVFGT